MKKFIYFILFVASVLTIISLFVFPVYKFDDDLIKKNNINVGSQAETVDTKIKNEKDKKVQQQYKDSYFQLNQLIYSYINEDKDLFYETYKYKVVDYIYFELTGTNSGLTNESKKEQIESVEKTLKDTNKDTFDNVKTQAINTLFEDGQNEYINQLMAIATSRGYTDPNEYTIVDGKEEIIFSLLNLNYGLDSELKNVVFEDASTKGIYLKDIVKSIGNLFKSYKELWNSSLYEGQELMDKVAGIIDSFKIYNPFPLLLLAFIYFVIVLSVVITLFSSLKGLIGKNYPHTVFRSIFIGGICVLLLLAYSLLPTTFYLSYHNVEFFYLLEYLMFGKASIAMLATTGLFVLGLLFGVIGRFCKWGKRRRRNYDRDYD